MPDETRIHEEIIEAGKRLYQKGFVAANDGNISARLDGGRICITPSGVCKGDMDPGMMVVVDGDGNVLSGDWKPSSETKMHLAVYKTRPDVQAIVHAHPQKATAFAVAGLPLDKPTLPEAVLTLRKIAFSEYGTPSTNQVPEAVVRVIGDAGAVLLANHGALTVGKGVMETLEHFAAITLYARLLGGERELDPTQMDELLRIRREVFGKTDA
mgnify:CR=1 FL=1